MSTLVNALSMLVTTPVVPAALVGLVWGILGGALPGISPSITMALLLPVHLQAWIRPPRSCCSPPPTSAPSTAARSRRS